MGIDENIVQILETDIPLVKRRLLWWELSLPDQLSCIVRIIGLSRHAVQMPEANRINWPRVKPACHRRGW